MTKINVKIDGLDKLEKEFSRIAQKIGPFNRAALQTIAADLKGKAIRLAPVDTGDLRGSAFYRTMMRAGGYEATIGFTMPYALIQHERLDFHHPKGGQAKYLESPFAENTPRYIKMLADANKKLGD